MHRDPDILFHSQMAAVAAYWLNGGSWLLFAVLFPVSDIFMPGYLIDKRRGAAIYNLGHTTILPGIGLASGLMMRSDAVISVALIWLAHIGFDRGLGYGLKYPDSFQKHASAALRIPGDHPPGIAFQVRQLRPEPPR